MPAVHQNRNPLLSIKTAESLGQALFYETQTIGVQRFNFPTATSQFDPSVPSRPFVSRQSVKTWEKKHIVICTSLVYSDEKYRNIQNALARQSGCAVRYWNGDPDSLKCEEYMTCRIKETTFGELVEQLAVHSINPEEFCIVDAAGLLWLEALYCEKIRTLPDGVSSSIQIEKTNQLDLTEMDVSAVERIFQAFSDRSLETLSLNVADWPNGSDLNLVPRIVCYPKALTLNSITPGQPISCRDDSDSDYFSKLNSLTLNFIDNKSQAGVLSINSQPIEQAVSPIILIDYYQQEKNSLMVVSPVEEVTLKRCDFVEHVYVQATQSLTLVGHPKLSTIQYIPDVSDQCLSVLVVEDCPALETIEEAVLKSLEKLHLKSPSQALIKKLATLAASGNLGKLQTLIIQDYRGDFNFIEKIKQLTELKMKNLGINQVVDFKQLTSLETLCLEALSFPEDSCLDFSKNTLINNLTLRELNQVNHVILPESDGVEIDFEQDNWEDMVEPDITIELRNCRIQNVEEWLYQKNGLEDCVKKLEWDGFVEQAILSHVGCLYLSGTVEEISKIISEELASKTAVSYLNITLTDDAKCEWLSLEGFLVLTELVIASENKIEGQIKQLLIKDCPRLYRISNNHVSESIELEFSNKNTSLFLQGMKINFEKIESLIGLKSLELEKVALLSESGCFPALPSLTSLTLKSCHFNQIDLQKLSKLQTLSINRDTPSQKITLDLSKNSALQYLTLCNVDLVSGPLPNLKKLILDDVTWDYTHINKSCQASEISISHPKQKAEQPLALLTFSLQHLRELTIKEAGHCALHLDAPALEVLDVSDIRTLNLNSKKMPLSTLKIRDLSPNAVDIAKTVADGLQPVQLTSLVLAVDTEAAQREIVSFFNRCCFKEITLCFPISEVVSEYQIQFQLKQNILFSNSNGFSEAAAAICPEKKSVNLLRPLSQNIGVSFPRKPLKKIAPKSKQQPLIPSSKTVCFSIDANIKSGCPKLQLPVQLRDENENIIKLVFDTVLNHAKASIDDDGNVKNIVFSREEYQMVLNSWSRWAYVEQGDFLNTKGTKGQQTLSGSQMAQLPVHQLYFLPTQVSILKGPPSENNPLEFTIDLASGAVFVRNVTLHEITFSYLLENQETHIRTLLSKNGLLVWLNDSLSSPLSNEVISFIGSLLKTPAEIFQQYPDFQELLSTIKSRVNAFSFEANDDDFLDSALTNLDQFVRNLLGAELIRYFRGFTPKQPSDAKLPEKFDNLSPELKGFLKLLFEKKGACRHRAYWAFLLLNYFKIPCVCALGSAHQWLVFDGYYDQMTSQRVARFYFCDLGGQASDITYHEQNNLSAVTDQPSKMTGEIYYEFVKAAGKSYLDLQTFFNETVDHKQPRTRLAYLNRPNQALLLAQAFIKYCQERKIQICYIHTPQEIDRLIEQYTISGVEDGPLKRVMAGSGVLLINWMNFSDQQMASYKSVADNPNPAINQKPISTNLTVVGLLLNNLEKQPSDPFLSRHLASPAWLDDKCFPLLYESEAFLQNQHWWINLFHSEGTWSNWLLSEISFSNTGEPVFKKSNFMLAFKNLWPIVLYNPPNSLEFESFIFNMKQFGYTDYDGEFYPPHANIHFKEYQEEIACELAAFDSESHAEWFILNEGIFVHQLGPNFYFNSQDLLETRLSRLRALPEGTPILLTSIFNSDQLSLLMTITAQQGLKLHYTPGLRPDEGGLVRDRSIKDTSIFKSKSTWYVCDDLFGFIRDSSLVEPECNFMVTKETKFNELFYALEPASQDNHYKVVIKKPLEALFQGKSIVFVGELSAALCYQIEELLCQGRLYIPDERQLQTFSGKIYIVSTHAAHLLTVKTEAMNLHRVGSLLNAGNPRLRIIEDQCQATLDEPVYYTDLTQWFEKSDRPLRLSIVELEKYWVALLPVFAPEKGVKIYWQGNVYDVPTTDIVVVGKVASMASSIRRQLVGLFEVIEFSSENISAKLDDYFIKFTGEKTFFETLKPVFIRMLQFSKQHKLRQPDLVDIDTIISLTLRDESQLFQVIQQVFHPYFQSMPELEALFWQTQKEINSAYTLVKDGVLLENLQNQFIVTHCREKILNQLQVFASDSYIQAGKGKRLILLEGPSGVGKTTLLIYYLEAKGYHSGKDMVFLVSGQKGTKEAIIEAYINGQIVILDELNLDKEVSDLLIALFSPHAENNPYAHRKVREGFFVFASQNPSSYRGCQSLPSDLLNLSHIILVPDYDKKALEEIYRGLNLPEETRESYVNAYLEAKKDYPDRVNARSYFKTLHNKVERLAAEKRHGKEKEKTRNASNENDTEDPHIHKRNKPLESQEGEHQRANEEGSEADFSCLNTARFFNVEQKRKKPHDDNEYSPVESGTSTISSHDLQHHIPRKKN